MEYFVTITIKLNERYSLNLCIGSTFYFLKIKLKLKLRIIFFFLMIIIEKSLFKFSRSIENFISTPVSFFFSFPRIFIHVYETNECHFFFLFPRFSINSRKVLLKYSARNSSEEGGEEVRNFFFFRGTSGKWG